MNKEDVLKIKDKVKCPQLNSIDYGEWGALRLDQRKQINELCDSWLILYEENRNDYFIHMEEWARAIGNNAKLRERIDKAIEYCEEITSKEIDISDNDYDLGQDFTARDILKILEGKDE